MVGTTYLNFDLRIESWHTGYRAHLTNSPVGQAGPILFDLPFSEEELITLEADGREFSFNPQDFGNRLFQAIFRNDIGHCLQRSIEKAKHTGGVRIRLHLVDAPKLANLPWEYLYDNHRHCFLALSRETPIVRYMDIATDEVTPNVKLPLRILVMVSNPKDISSSLDIEREWNYLEKVLNNPQNPKLFILERLEYATFEALQQRLQKITDVHVFHFIGHGFFDKQLKQGNLVFEDQERKSHVISADALAMLLHDHPALRLVFLNACQGALSTRNDPFAGLAQHLVQQEIPAVIAMQSVVKDSSAAQLAYSFYSAFVNGYPVDAALTEARKTLFAKQDELNWGTPLLFMRTPNGHLFNIDIIKNAYSLADPQAILTSVVEPFKYACYVSYHHGQRGLIQHIINGLEEALSGELELWRKEQIFIDKNRLNDRGFAFNEELTAKTLYKSVCMIMVFTPRYFSQDLIYCAREYAAMEKLERYRLQLLGKTSLESHGLIIPITLKEKYLPPEIKTQRRCYRFDDFLLSDPELPRHPSYAPMIRDIAEYIAEQCNMFDHFPEVFNTMDNFELPSEVEVISWLKKMQEPTPTPFPGRRR